MINNSCKSSDTTSIIKHIIYYITDISESSTPVSTVPIDPSYNYFEAAQWFKFNCSTYFGLNKYVTAIDISLWYATKEYSTWIFITPLGDKLSTNSMVSSNLSMSSIIIPNNYQFNINSTSQKTDTITDYYANFDNIFNDSIYDTIDMTPKLLSKTISSNISPNFVQNEYVPLTNDYTNDSIYSKLEFEPTVKISPFVNFWGPANCPFSFSSTGVYTVENEKTILSNSAIVIDGKYREI